MAVAPRLLVLLVCLISVAICIEENNLLQNDLTKDTIIEKDKRHDHSGLDHGIEHGFGDLHQDMSLAQKQDLLLSGPPSDPHQLQEHQHKDDDVAVDIEPMADDNLAVESGQTFTIRVTTPKSFLVPQIEEEIPGDASVIETSGATNAPPTLCLCDPPCVTFNSSSNSSSNCTSGRFAARKDCPCCRVCMRQEGESCGTPNEICDKQFGLHCSEENLCVGKYSKYYNCSLQVRFPIVGYSMHSSAATLATNGYTQSN